MNVKQILVVVSVVLFSQIYMSCGEANNQSVVKRDNQPDYIKEFDEDLMDSAIAEAKSTIGNFILALKSKKKNAGRFAVKKGFPVGKDGLEYMWVANVKLINGVFVGIVGNEPVDTKAVKLGDSVKITKDELCDWMYMDSGKLKGGYTIVALAYGTPEQGEYQKNLGIDWKKYRFLKNK